MCHLGVLASSSTGHNTLISIIPTTVLDHQTHNFLELHQQRGSYDLFNNVAQNRSLDRSHETRTMSRSVCRRATAVGKRVPGTTPMTAFGIEKHAQLWSCAGAERRRTL